MAESRSSRSLDALLDADCDEARSIRGSTIHRTVLWRYRTGKGKPAAAAAAELDRLSNGKVPANGWEDDPPAVADQTKPTNSAA